MAHSLVEFENCDAGPLPVHTHHTPHACFVLDGAMMDHEWRKGEAPASAGDLLINPAGTRHAIEAGGDGLTCLVVEWPAAAGMKAFRRQRIASRLDHISAISNGLHTNNPARQILTQLEIASRLMLVANDFDDEAPVWVADARREISDNGREFSVASLAKTGGVHRATLTKTFRNAYGLSPEQYKMLLKLEHAASLMVAGVSLAEAAPEARFSDQAHLTRVWRRYLGTSPKRWLTGQATIVQDSQCAMLYE